MKLPRKYCYEYLDDDHVKYLNDTHIEDLDSIYITKLLIRSIYNGESGYLSYCINVLIRKQLVEEVFKILQEAIRQNGSSLSRKDSGYESDFEIGEAIQQYEYPDQYVIDEAIKIIIKTLINAGINIGTYKYETVETPLHWATTENNIDLVNLFIKVGVDVDIKNNRGATALHLAVINNDLSTVEAIINARAKVNEKDHEGNTPLHLAVYSENYDIVKSLLKASANPFIKDNIGKTPFDYALEKNKVQILQKLIHHKYYNNNSLLHLAAENDNVQAVEYLIKKEIFDINLENGNGNSPLHLASERGYVKIVEILLNKGAIIDDWEECGYTALQKAGINGHLDVVKLLLTKGANVNTSNLYGATIIHLVISQYIELFENRNNNDLEQSNILNVIRYLLDYDKLDINAQIQPLEFSESPFLADKKMKTVLHHLISSDVPAEHQDKKMGLIRVILTNQKVDPFIKDAENKTPIDYYIEQKKYSSRILDQYAKIQEDRSTRIESYNTKKYIMSAIALCMINATLGGLYIDQYPLEIISDIQSLGLALIANVVVCICCYVISKYVEKSIEEKYKNKVLDLFENNNKVPCTLEGNLTLEGCYKGKTI